MEQQLEALGDPSGQQDSSYWNDWFQIVCCQQEHRPFEWYCSAEEVIRVLSHHLPTTTGTTTEIDRHPGKQVHPERRQRWMIHPGSGTSLLPLKLQSIFPHSHVVLDVSSVAIDEMKQVHERQQQDTALSSNQIRNSCSIEYHVTNVLDPPLAGFDDATFECWIDKGFVDAVFSSNQDDDSDCQQRRQQEEQARRMFDECHRLLTNGNKNSNNKDEEGIPAAGFALIVSLAEAHSTHLILDPWLNQPHQWSSTLHVWELEPLSGILRPFCFVLTKKNASSAIRSKADDHVHRRLVWHYHSDDGNTAIITDDVVIPLETAAQEVQQRLHDSRFTFAAAAKKKESNGGSRGKLLVTLDVKPYTAETDLVALAECIRNTPWEVSDTPSFPEWQPFSSGDLQEIVPIGFGISKLRLACLVPSDGAVDALVSALEEWDGNETFEDGIQSVDLESVVPVGESFFHMPTRQD